MEGLGIHNFISIKQTLVSKCIYRRGQHFAVDSVSSISNVLYLKLISTVILKELNRIEKYAICLDTFLRF